MELLRKVQTRFQECVLIIAFSLLAWTSMGGFTYLLGQNESSFIYFGDWGYKFVSLGFKYFGLIYFLLPIFIYTFGSFVIKKTESITDLLSVWDKVLSSTLGLFFLSIGLSALTHTLTHHYSYQFSKKLAKSQGGLIGELVGGKLYLLSGFNGALLVLFSALSMIAILTTDFKISDIILAAEDHIKNTFSFTKKAVLKTFRISKAICITLLSKNSSFNKLSSTKAALEKQIEIFSTEVDKVAINSDIQTSHQEVEFARSHAPNTSSQNPAVKKKTTHKLKVAVDNTNPGIAVEELTESAETTIEQEIIEEGFQLRVQNWKKTYNKPKASFLTKTKAKKKDLKNIKDKSALVQECLAGFGLNGKVVAAHSGDRLTMFEFNPDTGVKISKIQSLTNDLALNLGAPSIRILAPIPGKTTVGIEIPNDTSEMLTLGNLIETTQKDTSAVLPFVMGKNVYNEVVVEDLSKMPHLLVSGTTGSGKSVFTNCFITGLIFNKSPKDLRFIMIDPKMIELTPYNGIPHLLKPVISDVEESKDALVWAENEMDRRYKVFSEVGARNIDSFNKKIKSVNKKSLERKLGKKIDDPLEHMPYIVIVIDELADLMITQGKEVEKPITRIAQKARACGIHLVLATQRPSAEIVTGLIKTNFPSRVAFKVSSSIDSRTILDASGAEKLLGQGDMLYLPNGKNIVRLQGAFVSEDEVNKVVKYISK